VYLTTKEETAWGSVLGALVGAVLALPCPESEQGPDSSAVPDKRARDEDAPCC